MEKDLIFDVGMHKGADSEFYLKKGFRVVAIEAQTALVNEASRRMRSYVESGQLVILNIAIASEDGPLTFWENSFDSAWSTASPEWKKILDPEAKYSIQTTVHGRAFAGILKEYGIPYYLKIDVEGSDMLCLEALKQFESRPRYVSIESIPPWTELRRQFAVFKELGYSRFKAVAQHRVARQICPLPALEGAYVDHHFEELSSGLFGNETPGKWVDESRALKKYRRIFLRYPICSVLSRLGLPQRFVPDPGWFDTHAMLG